MQYACHHRLGWGESRAEPPPRKGDAWLLDDAHDEHMMSVCGRGVLSVSWLRGAECVWSRGALSFGRQSAI